MKKCIVCLDGSPMSLRALELAIEASRCGETDILAVTAEIKAPWVVLETCDELPKATTTNRFLGTVELTRFGELTSEVIVVLSDGTRLCALITTQSARELELSEGRQVWAMFNAFAVVLHVE